MTRRDRDQWDLRGPVRVCHIHRTWYVRRCGADSCETKESGDSDVLDFRPDGALARQRHRNPDGSESTAVYEYDEAGKVAVIRTEDASGVTSLRFHQYDPAGRLVHIVAHNDDSDRVAETYDYDDGGRKKKTNYALWTAQPNMTYSWAVEGADAAYGAPGAAAVTTLHDQHDRPVGLLFQNAEGGLLSRVDFLYDAFGNLVEEAQTNSVETISPKMRALMNEGQLKTVLALMGGDEPIRRLHRYDEQGRRIETRSSKGVLSDDRKVMAYNEHGDLVEEIFEIESREYAFNEEGQLSDNPTNQTASRTEARIRYDYDARGNWLTKTVEGRAGAGQDFTVSSVEKRSLDYFD